MKFKNKASRYGYIFGSLCKVFGTVIGLILLPFITGETTIIHKEFLIPTIICAIIAYYGIWRTGGIHYD